MATSDELAQWIVSNKDKQGTPEFETVAASYKAKRAEQPAPVQQVEQPSTFEDKLSNDPIVAAGAGLLKGAADIGATLMSPFDAAGLTGFSPSERRERLRQFAGDFKDHNIAFGAGEIGANIAGTAGAGGLLAKGLGMIPKVAATAPGVLDAISSGGFTGTLPQRIAGGAVSGGAQAAMVNPQDAGMGAGIGAALPAGVSAVTKGLPFLTKAVTGVTTGVGTTPLEQAYSAGKRGGDAADMFRANINKDANILDVLDSVKSNLEKIKADKYAAYKNNMMAVNADKSVLDFKNIDQALADAYGIVTYKGQIKNEKGAEVVRKISDMIGDWKNLPADEFHTPEGLDALKQKINGVIETLPFEERTARKVGSTLYNSVKNEISKQAPGYSKAMKDYHDASDLVTEMERALSLKDTASADTKLRKLQSLMRNNVSTNYGARVDLANKLEQQGGHEFMPALAGQALNEWTPRGIAKAGNLAGFIAAGAANPWSLSALPITSPRLMGEAAYGFGAGTRHLNNLANLAGANQVPTSLTQAAINNALISQLRK